MHTNRQLRLAEFVGSELGATLQQVAVATFERHGVDNVATSRRGSRHQLRRVR